MVPVVQALAREMPGHVRVAPLNVDENPVTADRSEFAAFLSANFQSGPRDYRIVDAQPKSEIVRRLARAIGRARARSTRRWEPVHCSTQAQLLTRIPIRMASQKKEKAHGRQGAHQVAGELLPSIAPGEKSGAI